MNLPLGYAYSALYAGIRQAEKDDLTLDRQRASCERRRGVHAESSAGRAGKAEPPAPEALEGAGGRGGDQCRQRQLRDPYGRRRCARDLQGGGQIVEAAGGSGVARIDWRDRRGTRPEEDSGRAAAADRWARSGTFRGCVARHHDYGPDAQDRVCRSETAARDHPDRGHDEGLGHDPSADGDHAGLRDDRCRYPDRSLCARC